MWEYRQGGWGESRTFQAREPLVRICRDRISRLYLWGSRNRTLGEGRVHMGLTGMGNEQEQGSQPWCKSLDAGWQQGEPLGVLRRDGLLGKVGSWK